MVKKITSTAKLFIGISVLNLMIITGIYRLYGSKQFKSLKMCLSEMKPEVKVPLISKKAMVLGNNFDGNWQENGFGPGDVKNQRSMSIFQNRLSTNDFLKKEYGLINKVLLERMSACSSTETAFIKEVQSEETIRLPGMSKLQELTTEEVSFLYHRYINNIQYSCKRKVRLGNLDDGGWDICDEFKYRPKPPCLVYSFGIGNDFSFDDAVVKKYGCEVHSFDPTMANDSYRRGPLNYFHAIGLSRQHHKTKSGKELLTYRSIRQRLNHTEKKISIVKIDVEGWENGALPNMLGTDALRDVDNLSVEFHLPAQSLQRNGGPYAYVQAISTLKQLYDVGFRIFWNHQNPTCKFLSRCRKELRSACNEVNFVKVLDA